MFINRDLVQPHLAFIDHRRGHLCCPSHPLDESGLDEDGDMPANPASVSAASLSDRWRLGSGLLGPSPWPAL